MMRRSWVAVAIVGALAVAGCSSRTVGAGSDAAAGGDLVVDFGVTATTITLGTLTDLSGPFASLATPWARGQQLYYDELNAAGGVCGRRIEVLTRDHGYDVQHAVQLYAETVPQVLGYTHLVGSPMITALLPDVSDDHVVSAVGSWASPLLENPYVLMAGTPSDLEMINGVEYLAQQGVVASGDTIGAIYVEGEYGANGLAGARHAAHELGLDLVEASLKATDTDATSIIAQFAQRGVAAITLTTSSAQTASAVSVAAQLLPNATFVANSAAFVPGLLDTTAAEALEKHLFVVGSALPFSSDDPAVAEVRAAYEKRFPGGPGSAGVTYGYGVAKIYGAVLQQACRNGDMSRAGMETALRQTTDGDTGVIAPLDFSQQGAPPSRAAYVARPSRATVGGLDVVQDVGVGPLARTYAGG